MKKIVGIDYGQGLVNVDQKTGIRYGVIHQHEVLQAWADSSEPYYGEEDGEEIDEFAEPISFYVDDGEYMAESDDYGDIFITKSPFYTVCAFCSPCAPGAGYLMDTVENGAKSYCFGHDWFEDGKAPYPVYDVKTGELVKG